MYNVIVDHARNNVWCAPLQDYEHTIMPARLTPAGGWYRYAKVIWDGQIPLPNAKNAADGYRYHVYQIGKYPDFLLGVEGLSNDWINLETIMEKTDCFVNCFIDNGISLKTNQCWLRLIKPSNNIVLAVQIDRKYSLGKVPVEDPSTGTIVIENARLDYKKLYIRFYTNARLKNMDQRDKVNNPEDQVRVYSQVITTVSQVNAFVNGLDDPNKPKFGWLRLDGYVVTKEWLLANPFTAVGKTISSYHDDTIIAKKWFKLSDLKSFKSKKNPNVDKYIMFYGREIRDMIYNNDVEYFLGVKRGDQFNGVYVPRFKIDTVTNLTHAIHALDSNVIDDLIENNSDTLMNNQNDLFIYAVMRQGGMINGLTHEANRIEDMYRMSEEDILFAMQDLNSVLPEWKAADLEIDSYTKLMSAPLLSDLTPELIVDGYGFNGLTKYLQPNPGITTDIAAPYTGTTLRIPDNLTKPDNVVDLYLPIETVEYDENGKFLGINRKLFPGSAELSFVKYQDTAVRKVEVYVNNNKSNSKFRLIDNYEAILTDIDLARFGFRFYTCSLVDGKPNFNWIDSTDTTYYTYSTTGMPTIRMDTANLTRDGLAGMVRINNRSSVKTGLLSDLISGNRDYGVLVIDNQDNGYTTMIAGQIDIWVDGYKLHEDLDYAVLWPKIYIAKHIINKAVKYTARISGLPNPLTKKNFKATEFGFVKDGILSVDGKYQVHDSKNLQINVGGKLYTSDEVQFAEDSITKPLLIDGLPYSLTDYVTPIEFYSGGNTIKEKLKAMDLDNRVNSYLSLRLPTYTAKRPIVALGKRWEVVSLFFNEILYSLINGYLANELKTNWDLGQLNTWVTPFKFLLPLDVTNSAFFDGEYVSPMAHAKEFSVEVTIEQFNFLKQVNEIYLNKKIELEKYLYVTTSIG